MKQVEQCWNVAGNSGVRRVTTDYKIALGQHKLEMVYCLSLKLAVYILIFFVWTRTWSRNGLGHGLRR